MGTELTENGHYLAGGRLYWLPKGETTETEIGDIIDISLNVETQTAECLSRSNGTAEVVAEAVIKRDYTLTFTTTKTSAENLAMFFYAGSSAKTYAAGDTYINGAVLSDFDENSIYGAGECVIENGGVYRAIADINGTGAGFDPSEWKRLGGSIVKKLQSGAKSKIIGMARFESETLAGGSETIVIYQVSLAPSGDIKLVGDEFRQLVFTGKCQRTNDGVIDIYVSED